MLTCGKHRGKSYAEVAAQDRGYCAWVLSDGPCGSEFQGFASYLRSKHGGVLKVGRHKGLSFNEAWAKERDYCYWAASLESPGQPMKAFAAFARAKMKQEGGDTEEPERKRMRSQTFQCQICFDATVRNVLVPCGHMLCPGCAGQIRTNKCPFCRCAVQQIVKTFV